MKTPVAPIRAFLLMAAFAGVSHSASAQRSVDLVTLSLEELMNLQVTSVSRKSQTLASTPAAVFVITRDDIRRAGASSLPEALRLAPGIQVARYSNSKWSISARGMGWIYSSKLLVLVDGRSIFTPDFSGVFWDMHEVPLDNVDRIEVVRGPGGTMWGANAVNGVINIITKAAADTEGGLAVVNAGSEDRGLASVRYGGHLGQETDFRVDGTVSDRAFGDGDTSRDTRRIARGGFRIDRTVGIDGLTLEGDVFTGEERTPTTLPQLLAPYSRVIEDRLDIAGSNILGRWTRTASPTRNFVLKAYVDRYSRDEYIHTYDYRVLDVDFQHQSRVRPRHDVLWGAEYRHTTSDISASDVMRYEPGRSTRSLFSAFGQDEIALSSKLAVTVGMKVEQHEKVGLAMEPSLRTMWTLSPRHNVWAAVSRGVRTPSLADQLATFTYGVVPPSAATLGLPVEIVVVGSPVQYTLEAVVAYEAGYRAQPLTTVSVDVAVFRNHYDHLTYYKREPPALSVAGGIPHLVLDSRFTNLIEGESEGVEAVATWIATPRVSLTGSSIFMDATLRPTDPALEGGNSVLALLMSPRVQLAGRAAVQVGPRLDLSGTVQYVGPWQRGGVQGYSRTDVRGGWKLSPKASLDLGIQNLFDARHFETSTFLYTTATEIHRSGYARVAWTF